MSEQKNLIIAIALSLLILIGFNYFYERPKQIEIIKNSSPTQQDVVQNPSSVNLSIYENKKEIITREKALYEDSRIKIVTPKIHGTLNLKGGRLDDISLTNYHENSDPKSSNIFLLNPENTKDGYFVDFGWQGLEKGPGPNDYWHLKDASIKDITLSPNKPVTIFWENIDGVLFERTFAVDENYLFTVTDRILNQTSTDLKGQPYTQINRMETPITSGYFILHEGVVGIVDSRLKEVDYQKLLKENQVNYISKGGWIGFTDKYWLVASIHNQQETAQLSLLGQNDSYSINNIAPIQIIAPGQTVEYKQHVYIGAKVLRLLDDYEKILGFDHFDLAVDFGWFYFLTKPLFYILEFLHQLLGNLGLAILALTVLFKALFYPLANKSFRSMARMKALQPQMERLKEKYAHDKMKMNQELMELYKKEKVNPVSGCLPMLIQAPIFFCLYKVFFVTIEMRHAPFYGWIQDLSAPDPTSIFNLFGFLPFGVPSFLQIGALPLIMGLTMVLQQRLNPQPADPIQARMMYIMPVMFTYLFASFPAGLVIYWAWSNILTIIQQVLITRISAKQVPVNNTKIKRK